jgi:hypothetical protein
MRHEKKKERCKGGRERREEDAGTSYSTSRWSVLALASREKRKMYTQLSSGTAGAHWDLRG